MIFSKKVIELVFMGWFLVTVECSYNIEKKEDIA